MALFPEDSNGRHELEANRNIMVDAKGDLLKIWSKGRTLYDANGKRLPRGLK